MHSDQLRSYRSRAAGNASCTLNNQSIGSSAGPPPHFLCTGGLIDSGPSCMLPSTDAACNARKRSRACLMKSPWHTILMPPPFVAHSKNRHQNPNCYAVASTITRYSLYLDAGSIVCVCGAQSYVVCIHSAAEIRGPNYTAWPDIIVVHSSAGPAGLCYVERGPWQSCDEK
eukprot:6458659-Amphidinium_carterae.1